MIRFLYRAFRNPPSLLALVGLLLLASPGFTQLLATTDRVPTTMPPDARQEEQSRLDDLLNALQEEYDIFFLYEKRLLKNKKTNVKFDPEQNLETNLERMLRLSALTYEKIDDKTYVIVRKKSPTDQVQRVKSRPLGSAVGARPDQALANQSLWLADRSAGARVHVEANLVEKTISGTVTDGDSGEPLPGVNVLAKNTTQGTITDIDGNYQLSVPDDTEILVFSSVGYVSREVPIQSRSNINIGLTVSTQELGEVVVTALGIKKETKKLGYATAKVESEQITTNRTPIYEHPAGQNCRSEHFVFVYRSG